MPAPVKFDRLNVPGRNNRTPLQGLIERTIANAEWRGPLLRIADKVIKPIVAGQVTIPLPVKVEVLKLQGALNKKMGRLPQDSPLETTRPNTDFLKPISEPGLIANGARGAVNIGDPKVYGSIDTPANIASRNALYLATEGDKTLLVLAADRWSKVPAAEVAMSFKETWQLGPATFTLEDAVAVVGERVKPEIEARTVSGAAVLIEGNQATVEANGSGIAVALLYADGTGANVVAPATIDLQPGDTLIITDRSIEMTPFTLTSPHDIAEQLDAAFGNDISVAVYTHQFVEQPASVPPGPASDPRAGLPPEPPAPAGAGPTAGQDFDEKTHMGSLGLASPPPHKGLVDLARFNEVNSGIIDKSKEKKKELADVTEAITTANKERGVLELELNGFESFVNGSLPSSDEPAVMKKLLLQSMNYKVSPDQIPERLRARIAEISDRLVDLNRQARALKEAIAIADKQLENLIGEGMLTMTKLFGSIRETCAALSDPSKQGEFAGHVASHLSALLPAGEVIGPSPVKAEPEPAEPTPAAAPPAPPQPPRAPRQPQVPRPAYNRQAEPEQQPRPAKPAPDVKKALHKVKAGQTAAGLDETTRKRPEAELRVPSDGLEAVRAYAQGDFSFKSTAALLTSAKPEKLNSALEAVRDKLAKVKKIGAYLAAAVKEVMERNLSGEELRSAAITAIERKMSDELVFDFPDDCDAAIKGFKEGLKGQTQGA